MLDSPRAAFYFPRAVLDSPGEAFVSPSAALDSPSSAPEQSQSSSALATYVCSMLSICSIVIVAMLSITRAEEAQVK